MVVIPEVVRNKAVVHGAADWLDRLPDLVEELADEWSFSLVRSLDGGTESFVAEIEMEDASRAVLKLLIPRDAFAARCEIMTLQLVAGDGCAELFRSDAGRGAMLLERLGRSLSALRLPIDRRHRILVEAAARVWRPAPGTELPTGAEKGRWLAGFIPEIWERLDRPCSERTIEHALACLETRISAHDDERAVLIHGDVHQWNALEAGDGFKLVDPDGGLGEAEYDLGILMREDPEDILHGGWRERAAKLAAATGLNATAIHEWGVAERVSTGLLCTEIDLQPVGRLMLEVADRIAAEA